MGKWRGVVEGGDGRNVEGWGGRENQNVYGEMNEGK